MARVENSYLRRSSSGTGKFLDCYSPIAKPCMRAGGDTVCSHWSRLHSHLSIVIRYKKQQTKCASFDTLLQSSRSGCATTTHFLVTCQWGHCERFFNTLDHGTEDGLYFELKIVLPLCCPKSLSGLSARVALLRKR